MPLFPRVRQAFAGRTVRARGVGDVVQRIAESGQKFVCDETSVNGPFACLHNEHNRLSQEHSQITSNQAHLEDLLREVIARQDRHEAMVQELHAKADRIIGFLDRHFEGAP